MVYVVITFFVLLFLNMPVAYAIGMASILFFIIDPNLPVMIAVERVVTQTQSFSMLAIPFFIFAGNLMNETGITKRLIKFSNEVIGHLFGGLACVSCVLSAVMGGISGSAVADATMEARILGPDMLKRGYSKGYASAVVALTSVITATIPPSVGLIIYAAVTNVSVGRLFLAGMVPGVMITIALLFVSYTIAKKRDYPREREHMPPAGKILHSILECIWALLFPILLIVTLRMGVFTASEAGSMAVIYAIFCGLFIYRELTWDSFKNVLRNTLKDCGVVLFITALAAIFAYMAAFEGLSTELAKMLITITSNKYLMMMIIMVFLFFMGMFMESTVNTMLFAPIFWPIMERLGMNDIQFGLIFEIIVILGAMTPPVGTAMFSVCNIIDCDVVEYTKESLPFFAAILLVLLLILFVPQSVLWLPNLVFGAV